MKNRWTNLYSFRIKCQWTSKRFFAAKMFKFHIIFNLIFQFPCSDNNFRFFSFCRKESRKNKQNARSANEVIISIPNEQIKSFQSWNEKTWWNFSPQFYQFQTLPTTMCIKVSFIHVHLDKYQVATIEILMLREKNEKFKWVYVISIDSIVSVIVCSS